MGSIPSPQALINAISRHKHGCGPCAHEHLHLGNDTPHNLLTETEIKRILGYLQKHDHIEIPQFWDLDELAAAIALALKDAGAIGITIFGFVFALVCVWGVKHEWHHFKSATKQIAALKAKLTTIVTAQPLLSSLVVIFLSDEINSAIGQWKIVRHSHLAMTVVASLAAGGLAFMAIAPWCNNGHQINNNNAPKMQLAQNCIFTAANTIFVSTAFYRAFTWGYFTKRNSISNGSATSLPCKKRQFTITNMGLATTVLVGTIAPFLNITIPLSVILSYVGVLFVGQMASMSFEEKIEDALLTDSCIPDLNEQWQIQDKSKNGSINALTTSIKALMTWKSSMMYGDKIDILNRLTPEGWLILSGLKSNREANIAPNDIAITTLDTRTYFDQIWCKRRSFNLRTLITGLENQRRWLESLTPEQESVSI